jgi:hypothetical protein
MQDLVDEVSIFAQQDRCKKIIKIAWCDNYLKKIAMNDLKDHH